MKIVILEVLFIQFEGSHVAMQILAQDKGLLHLYSGEIIRITKRIRIGGVPELRDDELYIRGGEPEADYNVCTCQEGYIDTYMDWLIEACGIYLRQKTPVSRLPPGMYSDGTKVQVLIDAKWEERELASIRAGGSPAISFWEDGWSAEHFNYDERRQAEVLFGHWRQVSREVQTDVIRDGRSVLFRASYEE